MEIIIIVVVLVLVTIRLLFYQDIEVLFSKTVPYVMLDVWYNRAVYLPKKKYPNVFDEEGKYIKCRVGLILPMLKLPNGKTYYYKVTKIKSITGDWRFYVDNIRCNMIFHHYLYHAKEVTILDAFLDKSSFVSTDKDVAKEHTSKTKKFKF